MHLGDKGWNQPAREGGSKSIQPASTTRNRPGGLQIFLKLCAHINRTISPTKTINLTKLNDKRNNETILK